MVLLLVCRPQAPEDFAVVQKESSFRSPGHNVSPGSAGHVWHAPWIHVLTRFQSILTIQRKKLPRKAEKLFPRKTGKIYQKNREKQERKKYSENRNNYLEKQTKK